MGAKGGCLVVANQTVGGEALRNAIKERIKGGRATFYVLVPRIEPGLEASGWAPMQTPAGLSSGAAADAAASDEAGKRSQHRLNWLVKAIREAGGQADGEVGASNPIVAVRRVLSRGDFEEILISTLPPRKSRWLRMDVAKRVERLTDLPVEVVTALPSPQG